MKMRLLTTILIVSTILLVKSGLTNALTKSTDKKPILNELLRTIDPNKPQKTLNKLDNPTGEVNVPANERARYDREMSELKQNPSKYAEMLTGLTLMAETVLAETGYDPGPFDGVLDEKTRSALIAYQKNRKIPVTGDPLSYETFTQLEKDMKILDDQIVHLGKLFIHTDMWDDGYVAAKGTWIIAGEKQGWPEQTSEIQCFRDIGKCIEATAIVMRNDGEPYLSVALEIYEIERWDRHEIVTMPRETAFGCVRYVYRFNRLNKSVTGIRSTISDEGLCKGLDRGEKHLVLVDGFEITRNLTEDLQKKRGDLIQISPSLLKKLESGSEKKTK